MAAFLFCSFGILGMSLFGGVFYRSRGLEAVQKKAVEAGCRSTAEPILLGSNGSELRPEGSDDFKLLKRLSPRVK